MLDVVFEPAFLKEVRRKGLVLKQKLGVLVDRHPNVVEELRGEGLMLGLKCLVPPGEVVSAFVDAHVLAGDNVVRLLPPLIISDDEIELAVERMDQALDALDKRLAQGLSAAE